jgi:hypothetical protein
MQSSANWRQRCRGTSLGGRSGAPHTRALRPGTWASSGTTPPMPLPLLTHVNKHPPRDSSDGSRRRPCCRRPIPRPCCSGRCSPPAKSACVRSMVGKRSPSSPSSSPLTWPHHGDRSPKTGGGSVAKNSRRASYEPAFPPRSLFEPRSAIR